MGLGPAVLTAAGGGSGHDFISSVSLLSFSFPIVLYLSLSSLYCFFCTFSLCLWEMTEKDPQGLMCH